MEDSKLKACQQIPTIPPGSAKSKAKDLNWPLDPCEWIHEDAQMLCLIYVTSLLDGIGILL